MLPIARKGRPWDVDRGPAHYFDASGRVEKPEDFQGKHYQGQSGFVLGYSPSGEMPQRTFQVGLPGSSVPVDQAQPAMGAAPQATQPATTQPAQAGAAMPQALGANALMGAGQQMQEKRQTMMPLQGYQNALLRGF